MSEHADPDHIGVLQPETVPPWRSCRSSPVCDNNGVLHPDTLEARRDDSTPSLEAVLRVPTPSHILSEFGLQDLGPPNEVSSTLRNGDVEKGGTLYRFPGLRR